MFQYLKKVKCLSVLLLKYLELHQKQCTGCPDKLLQYYQYQFQTCPSDRDWETRKVQFKIYSETGDPIAIDCLQFEKGEKASRYSRIPKESDITVEYESTNSGFYEVHDLTLSPLRNTAVNGFLQIGPVPASDFDEEAPFNTTGS